MPAWGWFLLGLGVAAAAAVILYLLLRRTAVNVDRAGILASERTRLEAERDAERVSREAAEQVSRNLEAELREVANWSKTRLEALDEERRKLFRDLSGDPDAILERLDVILGRGPGDGGPPPGQGPGG